MKPILFFLSFFCLQISLHSQPFQKPLPDNIFFQELNNLKAVRLDQKRLSMANDLARRNTLLTAQARQISRLFADDVFRLDFLQNAYSNIYDRENIYDLYDCFAAFSTVMRFHDFMEQESSRKQRPRQEYDAYEDYSFPDYNYPSYKDYHNYAPCSQPLSDEDFRHITREILNYRDDDAKVQAAVKYAESNCMTVSQVMKLGSMIQMEQKRLEYMKNSYDHTYDIDNYSYGKQLFKENTYVNEFDNFVKDRRTRNGKDNRDKRPGTCRLSDSEITDIVATLKRQTFENTRLETAKQIISAKKCFSVMQLKQLVELFSFDNTKLDLAKYCYAFCIDRSDYYKLNNSFTFSRSVDDLNKFIQEQR